jgi:hypothetical protein
LARARSERHEGDDFESRDRRQRRAVDATRIYWGQHDHVWSAALDGGAPLDLVGMQAMLDDVGIDDASVFWIAGGIGGSIEKAPKAGGAAPTVLATATADQPLGLYVAGGNVYWVDSLDAGVLTVPAGGGMTRTVVAKAAGAMTADTTSLYLTVTNDGTVWRAALDGAGAPKMVAAMQAGPSGIALDATHVYWANSGDGSLKIAAK